MNDPIDALIRDIAVQHSVVVGRDDPILILQTINARLMDDMVHAQQRMLHEFQESLEAINLRLSHESKERAERILNASLTASKEASSNLLQENATTTAQTIERHVDGILAHTQKTVHHSQKIAFLNLAASAMTLIAAGLLFIGLLR
ncbi:TPA: conjugal transfer protein TraM [Legionella pneumophila]